jgi:hypothetical protein
MDTGIDFNDSYPGNQEMITALQHGTLQLEGQFLNSSNYTFLGKLTFEGKTIRVVYKPHKGEQALWDFPIGTLTRREAAAYLLSNTLGWDLVPPCIYRSRKAPLGAGSLQGYIEHDPDYHYFCFSEEDKEMLRPLVLFDLISNNADRKGGHVFFDAWHHLWAIDHGLCFHVEDKLRTVIWDFAGQEIPSVLLKDIQNLINRLKPESELFNEFNKLIRVSEIRAMVRRCEHYIEYPVFPFPTKERRPYPWPLI